MKTVVTNENKYQRVNAYSRRGSIQIYISRKLRYLQLDTNLGV